MLPVFLLGALSDLIRRDLGIGETAIGAAVTVMFLTAGVTAALVGRLTERVGATTALRVGVVVAGTATAALGAFAQRWWHLAVLVAVAGTAVSLVDTGAARAFADRIDRARQGSAFGIKEASVPSAALLAGIALPTVAATLGWRATFVAASGLAVLVLITLPSRAAGPATEHAAIVVHPSGTGRATVRFAVGVGLGAGAANAGATFLVPALTSRGSTATFAGAVLAIASVASILMRVLAGRRADDPSRRSARTVSGLLLLGAAGAVTLAVPTGATTDVIAAVALLGGGWGWTGLAFLAVVRSRPGAPAAAAGVVLTGLGTGGALGPLAFGAAADAGSYPLAWTVAAVALVAGAAWTASASRALDLAPSGLDGRPPPPVR